MTLLRKVPVLCWLILVCLAVFAGCRSETETGEPAPSRHKASDFFEDANVAALAEAASEDDVKRIDELIEKGADVNAVGKDDCTPLLYSMTAGKTKGFERLLERGADPNRQVRPGDSAVRFAACRHDSDFLKIVLAHGGNPNLRCGVAPGGRDGLPTPIFETIAAPNPTNTAILVKAGANIEVRNCYGLTPVMAAAQIRAFEVMYVLLEAGADCRATDSKQKSVTRYLLEAQVDDHQSDYAIRQKCIEFVRKKVDNFDEEERAYQEYCDSDRKERSRQPIFDPSSIPAAGRQNSPVPQTE
jgi:uncharacterized protein